jgi:hypothetical protein
MKPGITAKERNKWKEEQKQVSYSQLEEGKREKKCCKIVHMSG